MGKYVYMVMVSFSLFSINTDCKVKTLPVFQWITSFAKCIDLPDSGTHIGLFDFHPEVPPFHGGKIHTHQNPLKPICVGIVRIDCDIEGEVVGIPYRCRRGAGIEFYIADNPYVIPLLVMTYGLSAI